MTQAYQLAGSDVKAANSWDTPNLITAQSIKPPPFSDGQISIALPPLSYTVLTTQMPQ